MKRQKTKTTVDDLLESQTVAIRHGVEDPLALCLRAGGSRSDTAQEGDPPPPPLGEYNCFLQHLRKILTLP